MVYDCGDDTMPCVVEAMVNVVGFSESVGPVGGAAVYVRLKSSIAVVGRLLDPVETASAEIRIQTGPVLLFKALPKLTEMALLLNALFPVVTVPVAVVATKLVGVAPKP